MSMRQEDLIAMNEQIWASMFGLTLVSREGAEPCVHGAGNIGACVQLVGAWQGAIRVDCSLQLARIAAARLQQRAFSTLSMDDLRDTVGELANMAAGSAKCLLPQPTHISLPSVADGTDYDLSVRRGRVLLQCPFACEGEPLLVSLIERIHDLDREALTGRIQ